MAVTTIRRMDGGDHIIAIDTATGKTWTEPKAVARVSAPKKKGPGMARKAANFAGAAVKHVATGAKKVELAVIQERFAVCQNCPDDFFNPLEPARRPSSLRQIEVVGTCAHRKCGCYMHETETFPNKLSWSTQSCPRGHWSESI